MTLQKNVNKRAKSRTKVLMTATLASPNGAQSVIVRDISCEGAQIVGEQSIAAGQDTCFKRGSTFVAASIAWCRNGVAGLKFYRKLSASEQDASFPSVIPSEGKKK